MTATARRPRRLRARWIVAAVIVVVAIGVWAARCSADRPEPPPPLACGDSPSVWVGSAPFLEDGRDGKNYYSWLRVPDSDDALEVSGSFYLRTGGSVWQWTDDGAASAPVQGLADVEHIWAHEGGYGDGENVVVALLADGTLVVADGATTATVPGLDHVASASLYRIHRDSLALYVVQDDGTGWRVDVASLLDGSGGEPARLGGDGVVDLAPSTVYSHWSALVLLDDGTVAARHEESGWKYELAGFDLSPIRQFENHGGEPSGGNFRIEAVDTNGQPWVLDVTELNGWMIPATGHSFDEVAIPDLEDGQSILAREGDELWQRVPRDDKPWHLTWAPVEGAVGVTGVSVGPDDTVAVACGGGA